MTAKMYYDDDADPSALSGQTVAIIGYGSQGHAHALNLHESGVEVIVGLAPRSQSRHLVEDAGIRVRDVGEAVRTADVIMILVPDTAQKALYDAEIAPNLRPGQLLMFAHGFNIHFGRIDPPAGIDVGMVAPKGPGHLVRSVYQAGGGVPALFAVHRDPSGTARARVLAYARALGNTRAGVLETTFAEETETDLFGEQSVLCGGTAALVKMAFETLVEAGYQPELAYFETMHELKLIVDLMYRGGLNFMRFSVSDTAEYGDYVERPADHRRPRPRDDEAGPDRDPGRDVRRELDRRERQRAAGLRASPRAGPRPPHRAGRRGAPRPDGVPRPGRRPGRPGPGGGRRGSSARRVGPMSAAGRRRAWASRAGTVRIFDTTLRDGEQAPGAGLTAAEKLEVARQLVRLKVDVIEAGFPAASPGDFEAVQRIARETKGVGRGGPRPLPGRRPPAGRRGHPGRGAAASPRLHRDERHPPQAQAPDRSRRGPPPGAWSGSATGANALGRDAEIEFSAEDASRTDVDYLLEVYEAVVAAGASTVNIPDTVGYAIPAEFGALVGRVVDRVGSDATVSVHCHNDLGLATANTLAAVQAGARQVEVHDQRPRRASRQRVAGGGRHGPPDAADPVPRPGLGRPDRAAHGSQPAGQLPHRVRRPAQQGGRGRQRLRPRIGDPPGRDHQEPAHLRDHDPAVGGAQRQPADDRQAVGPARASGQAPGARPRPRRARRSTRSTARRSLWPTPRRRSPTPTCWRSSRRARRRSRPRSPSRAGA